MAWGPAPCRSIWRKPRVLGWDGASCAATPEPEGCALIVLAFSRLARGFLSLDLAHPGTWLSEIRHSAAAAGAAAVLALITSAIGHHQHAALAAGRRAFMRVGQLHGGGRSGKRSQRRKNRWSGDRRASASRVSPTIQLQVVRRNESPAEPARDVVQHR